MHTSLWQEWQDRESHTEFEKRLRKTPCEYTQTSKKEKKKRQLNTQTERKWRKTGKTSKRKTWVLSPLFRVPFSLLTPSECSQIRHTAHSILSPIFVYLVFRKKATFGFLQVRQSKNKKSNSLMNLKRRGCNWMPPWLPESTFTSRVHMCANTHMQTKGKNDSEKSSAAIVFYSIP